MKYDYEVFFEGKLKLLAAADDILDIGGGHPFQKRMAKYKHWFDGKKFATVDSSPKYNPTYLGDAHNLPIKDNSISAVLCVSVLEHLTDPAKAAQEIYRVLKPGGQALIYTHFIYPYHARRGVYSDYFRFTDEGLRFIFKDFSQLELRKQGGYFRTLGFFMPGQAKWKFLWEPVTYWLDKLFRTENRSTTIGYYVYVIK